MALREVYRVALLHGATTIVLAHNRPSGDAHRPHDEAITRRLVTAGQIVGLVVLDHLVNGHGRWVSLARRRLV